MILFVKQMIQRIPNPMFHFRLMNGLIPYLLKECYKWTRIINTKNISSFNSTKTLVEINKCCVVSFIYQHYVQTE